MMFRCFKFVIILLTLAVIILEGFAFTSTYTNKSYLNKSYMYNIHVTQINFAQVIDFLNIKKRSLEERDDGLYKGNCYYGNSGSYGGNNGMENPCSDGGSGSVPVATTAGSVYTNPGTANSVAATINTVNTATSTYGNTATTTNSYTWTVNTNTQNSNYATTTFTNSKGSLTTSTISPSNKATKASNVSLILIATDSLSANALNVYNLVSDYNYAEIGLADVYAVNMWGYCKGRYANESEVSEKFDNNNITYYWCSKPKPKYHFNPLKVLSTDINSTISLNSTDTNLRNHLKVLSFHINSDTIRLPGSLESKMKSLNNIQDAVWILLLLILVFSIVSIVIQLLGCIISPESCCLSFLNYLFQCALFIVSVVAAGLVTGKNLYIRLQINDNTDIFGMKSYLSVSYYAYVWSACAAGYMICVIALLGHCCGLFSTSRRNFRRVVHKGHVEHHSDDEKGHSSDSD